MRSGEPTGAVRAQRVAQTGSAPEPVLYPTIFVVDEMVANEGYQTFLSAPITQENTNTGTKNTSAGKKKCARN